MEDDHSIRQVVQFVQLTVTYIDSFRHIQIFRETKCLVVIDDPINHKSNIYLYDLVQGMGEPAKTFSHSRVGTDFRIAVDETSRLLALYSSVEVCIQLRSRGYDTHFNQLSLIVFQFDEQFTHLQQRGADANLRKWYPSIPAIAHLIFVPGGEELCLIESSGNSRIFSLTTGHFRYVSLCS